MGRRSLAVCAAVLATATVAACSSTTATSDDPQPAPNTGASSSDHPALPYAGAPKVPHPLPASVLSGDPCTDALTPTQVKDALGKSVVGEPGTTAGLGRKCVWTDVDTTSVISVFFVTDTGQGLSAVYANSKPQAQVWKELPPIQGFPAVAYLAASGGDPQRSCSVNVGISDSLSIGIAVSVGRSSVGTVDPCSVAPKAADAVVTTLRQKAGG
jgi:hypothetical protein